MHITVTLNDNLLAFSGEIATENELENAIDYIRQNFEFLRRSNASPLTDLHNLIQEAKDEEIHNQRLGLSLPGVPCKINAIKEWRRLSGCGLKEAKDNVEAVMHGTMPMPKYL